MSKRKIILHVGTPKTGTSYLQDVLHRNGRVLAEHGILYPGNRFDAHFLAALDLMRLPWGGLETEAVGAWERLAAQVRQHRGTTIISHEILARASRAQVDTALRDLGVGDGVELHLVVSARDLVRQIPAEWQENVKHRATLSYGQFLTQLRDPERSGRIASWFWAVQDLPAILERWGSGLPPERVHLITVPPAGGTPGCCGSDSPRSSGWLGCRWTWRPAPRTHRWGCPRRRWCARLNAVINPHVAPVDYRPLVRELIVHQTLSHRRGSPRLAVPPDLHPWVVGIAGEWISALSSRGYAVAGDLEELRGAPPVEQYADPDHPAEEEVSAAALDAVRVMVSENTRLRGEIEGLHGELSQLREALHRRDVPATQRAKEAVFRRMTASRAGRAGISAYRRVRGRNSRSA